MQDEKTEPIRLWLSGLPTDRDWLDELAENLRERLRSDHPGVEIELGIPLADDELCILVATQVALDDQALVTAWRHLGSRDDRTLLVLVDPDDRLPPWLERRAERIRLDTSGGEAYRVDLSKIIAKYIGETEKNS